MKQVGIFLFMWIGGAAFCIPNLFISRFYTPQSIWLVCFLLLYTYLFFCFKKIEIHISDGCLLNLVLIALIGLHSLFFSNYDNISKLCIAILICGLLMGNIRNISIQLPFAFEMLVLLGLIEALWAIGQFLHILPVYHSQFYITGSFDNPAGLAIFLSSIFPFVLTLMKYQKETYRIICYCIAILFIVVVIFSNSRTGILAIGTIIFIRLFKVVYPKKDKLIKLLLFIFVFVVFVIGLFVMKINSGYGRLNIWNISWNMVKDRPIIGHGKDAFQAKYMLYQSEYYRKNMTSKYAVLADNVKHPFNEYLKINIEYDFVGILILLIYCFVIAKIYINNRMTEKYPVLECLISIGICAIFSYPLNYPVIWGMLAFSISIIIYHEDEKKVFICNVLNKYIICALFIFYVLRQINIFQLELEWKNIADQSLRGETKLVLPKYVELYFQLENNGLFLYNYGAELNYVKMYNESIVVLIKCTHFINDFDVQLLLADNYMNIEMYDKAELCLKEASFMCPNRILPLYKLVEIYDKTGRVLEARELASEIILKPMKVNSFLYQSVINDMKKYIRK